jgi:hypothetical protein
MEKTINNQKEELQQNEKTIKLVRKHTSDLKKV